MTTQHEPETEYAWPDGPDPGAPATHEELLAVFDAPASTEPMPEDERRYVNTMAALAQIVTELGLANKLKVLELGDRFRDSELGLAKIQEIVEWFQEETAKNQAMVVQRKAPDANA